MYFVGKKINTTCSFCKGLLSAIDMRQKEIHPSLQPFLDGKVMLIDKPLQWTSFDIVRKIRNCTGIIKVGHAGTLDPLASGLLIVCTGKYTKKINEYMGMEKEYIGTFTLGAVTPTYDLESTPEHSKNIDHLTNEMIHAATNQFTGLIMQVPPSHSAIKQDGKPVYLAARKGIDVILEPRPVTIHQFIIEQIELPIVHFKVICSTGTYIRSLANDFGKALGVGGFMSSLRRSRIGNFLVADAQSIDQFVASIHQLKKLEG